MIENDMVLMTLVIFIPSLFAIALLFFPKGTENAMRWTALIGSAITLVLSLFMLVDYVRIVEHAPTSQDQAAMHGDAATLDARVIAADHRKGQENPPLSMDYVSRMPWISRFNIDYFLGIDGISLALIVLTTALSFLALIASWNIQRYVKGYLMLFLVLETGMVGTFLALDFFLFYIFWEVMLLPMYFLIGVWGGPRREYAAIKFFLYTLLGSVFILIALLAFYFTDVQDFADFGVYNRGVALLMRPGISMDLKPEAVQNIPAKITRQDAINQVEVHSFDLMVLKRAGAAAFRKIQGNTDAIEVRNPKLTGDEKIDANKPRFVPLKELTASQKKLVLDRLNQKFFTGAFQYTMFLLLFIGFAIKVPVFPFHTWLPDAHVEAPTPISMILAGVLLKMGGYGILRIAYPICPWAAEELAWWIALFGIINIVYGAFAAMAQTDFKKLVAYSSVSHMGYVILGIAVWSANGSGSQYWSWGMNGAMFQMIAHGISSAGMFFLVGVIYDRAHHRNLDNFRGLLEPMPFYGGVSAIIFFAALGLPGLCGFVGEVMVVLGTWNFSPIFSILSALTVVITAAYILWTMQRVYLGTNPAYKDYKDMNVREIVCAAPLVVLAVALGVFPNFLLMSWMEPSVSSLVHNLAALAGKG